MPKFTSHGTLFHMSCQSERNFARLFLKANLPLTDCYYHQDLH